MPSPSRENPWSSPEWKSLRNRILKDYCEICGSRSPPFQLHHTKPLPSYSETCSRVASKLFHELLSSGSLNTKLIEVSTRESCPNCGSIKVQGPRATIKPPFYCGGCHSRFDKPSSIKIENNKPLMRDFYKRYKEEIDKLTNEERDKQAAHYLSGEGVITVCTRCHRPTEQGKVLCKTCNHHFHSPRFKQCWECHNKKMIADGKVKCKFCNSKFHSSTEPACEECSFLRSNIHCHVCDQNKYSLSCYCYNCNTSLCEDCASEHSGKGHEVV